MSKIVSLRSFIESAALPTLVLVDLQRESVPVADVLDAPEAVRALANCRAVLSHARSYGYPVAFVRWSGNSSLTRRAARWIEGFEPTRSDMVFERNRPSCYASSAFAEVMANGDGDFVLAGFTGEGACLATAIDAFHRGHPFTFLSDASVSLALEEIAARDVHRTVTAVIGTYGKTIRTNTWLAGAAHWGRRLEKRNGNEHGRTAR